MEIETAKTLFCVVCQKPLPERLIRKRGKYCSDSCRLKRAAQIYHSHYDGPDGDLSTATVGAMHELLVCTELMKHNYYVFRAQSPACPCDLLAMKNRTLFRIEVTTGYHGTNKDSWPPKNERYQFDILAVVFHAGHIRWIGENGVDVKFPFDFELGYMCKDNIAYNSPMEGF